MNTLYQTITDQIVEAIEAGAPTYRMPWHRNAATASTPVNAVTSRPYRGLNVFMLGLCAEARGYASGGWATYQQWRERGCQVRKGEKATSVIFWKPIGAEDDTDEVEAARRRACVAKAYHVFNAEQVDGNVPSNIPELPESERIAAAERFVAAIPARISHGAQMPCYVPCYDEIRMVPFRQFTSAAAYYSVLAHELTHWSGAEARLARDLSRRFGSATYAMEELVAELGAAFIGGQLGLPTEPRTDHAPYIACWLEVLKRDPNAIFAAAGKAQAAADYLSGFSGEA